MHQLLDIPLKFVRMPFTRKFNYKSSAVSSSQLETRCRKSFLKNISPKIINHVSSCLS